MMHKKNPFTAAQLLMDREYCCAMMKTAHWFYVPTYVFFSFYFSLLSQVGRLPTTMCF